MTTVRMFDPGSAPNSIKNDIRNILIEVDEEFIPPLSSRTETFPSLNSREGGKSIAPYLEAISVAEWALAFQRNKLVGLLSLFTNHDNPLLTSFAPHAYVSTLAVRRHARRDGVANALYSAALNFAVARRFKFLTTRSWSVNDRHAALMRHLGFHEVHRVLDERGPGIDTVYFALRLTRLVLNK